jgi:hypothetical protein
VGARATILSTLGRTAMLLVLALVVWGGLLVASAVENAFGEGPGAALARLVPGAGGSFWDWLGLLSVVLVVVVVVTAAWLLARRQGLLGGEPSR